MSPLLKKLTYVLVGLTIAAGGYYLYTSTQGGDISGTENVTLTQDMLLSTQLFIERRTILENVRLDTGALDNPNFKSYRSFAEPLSEEPYGKRPNPFLPTDQ